MTAEDDFHDLLDLLHQLGHPNDDEPDDPHAGCWQPHTGADGHTDCDGQPL